MGTSIKNIGGGFGKSSSFWPAHAQTGSAAKGLSRVLGRGVSPDPPSHWADSRSTTPSPRDRQHLWRPPMGAREGRPTGQKPCRQPRGPRRAARARRGIFDLRAIEDGLARAFATQTLGSRSHNRGGEPWRDGTRDGKRSTGRRRCPSSPTSTRTLDFVRARPCARLGKPVAPRDAGPGSHQWKLTSPPPRAASSKAL